MGEGGRRVEQNYPRNMSTLYRKHAKEDPSSYQSKRRTYQVLIGIIIEGQKTVPMP